jgi:hypothetical protein
MEFIWSLYDVQLDFQFLVTHQQYDDWVIYPLAIVHRLLWKSTILVVSHQTKWTIVSIAMLNYQMVAEKMMNCWQKNNFVNSGLLGKYVV